jgi:hypothetical protein
VGNLTVDFPNCPLDFLIHLGENKLKAIEKETKSISEFLYNILVFKSINFMNRKHKKRIKLKVFSSSSQRKFDCKKF